MLLEERLKKARKYSKMSQIQLSEKLGITDRTLKRYEKKTNNIPLSMVKNISLFCQVNEIWLLTGQGDMLSENDPVLNSDVIAYENPLDIKHMQLVTQFKNKELAFELSSELIKLEKIDVESLFEINDFIKLKIKRKSSRASSNQTGRMVGKEEKKKA